MDIEILDNCGKVAALFREDEIANREDDSRLRRWANASGVKYPIAILPDSLFDKVGIRRSSVVVVSADGQLLYQGEIPIGEFDRQKVLSYLAMTNN